MNTFLSFYQSNINTYIPFYQKKVFEMLGLKIEQIKNDTITHGEFLNIRMSLAQKDELIIFFDIDAIPTDKEKLIKIIERLKKSNKIIGAAQTANHLNNGENLYIGPFFMGLSKVVYEKIGCPDLRENESKGYDVAQNLTEIANKFKDIEIEYLYPTHIEIPKWKLYPNKKFGMGTTYDDVIYHAFEIRNSQSNILFIKKCKEVIFKNRRLNYHKYLRIQVEIFIFKVIYKMKRLVANLK